MEKDKFLQDYSDWAGAIHELPRAISVKSP